MTIYADNATQRVTAGPAAVGMAVKTFTGKQLLSSGGQTITNVYTVTAGKTFYITDMYLSADGAAIMDTQIQANGVNIVRWPVKGDTSPLEASGIESQPSIAGGQPLTIVWPATLNANGFYNIFGYEQ